MRHELIPLHIRENPINFVIKLHEKAAGYWKEYKASDGEEYADLLLTAADVIESLYEGKDSWPIARMRAAYGDDPRFNDYSADREYYKAPPNGIEKDPYKLIDTLRDTGAKIAAKPGVSNPTYGCALANASEVIANLLLTDDDWQPKPNTRGRHKKKVIAVSEDPSTGDISCIGVFPDYEKAFGRAIIYLSSIADSGGNTKDYSVRLPYRGDNGKERIIAILDNDGNAKASVFFMEGEEE